MDEYFCSFACSKDNERDSEKMLETLLLAVCRINWNKKNYLLGIPIT